MTSPAEPSIRVRRARLEDLDLLVEFNAAMARETEGKVLDLGLVRPGVEAVLRDEALGFYLVAERGGQVAGQLLITYEWSDWRNALFWWIQSVYVLPPHRRTGVYRALHGYVTSEAESAGVCGLRLYVDQDNEAAQGVYASLGMGQARYYMYEVEF